MHPSVAETTMAIGNLALIQKRQGRPLVLNTMKTIHSLLAGIEPDEAELISGKR